MALDRFPSAVPGAPLGFSRMFPRVQDREGERVGEATETVASHLLVRGTANVTDLPSPSE